MNRNLSRTLAAAVASGTCLAGISAPTSAADQRSTLEEIVVTATKRAENLQVVPISVGVVTGEFIENFNVADMSDLQSFVPGLTVQQTFGSWSVRVRGLGSGITNLAFDSSVPIYIDDIYCGRGKCMEGVFMDMGRVEVARGPQGALFGKSTIAGAINAVTARPTDEFEAEIKVGVETQNGGYSTTGYISGPLSDTLRARLAVKYDDLDGYTKNTWLSQEDGDVQKKMARASFEWDASENTTVYLKLETGESNTDGRNAQLVNPPGPHRAFGGDPNPEYKPDDIRRVSTGVEKEDYYDYEWSSATLSVDTEMAGHTVRAIAGYWEYENDWFLDVDGYPARILNTALADDYDQTTLELRVLSPTDQMFEYIVGGWYQTSDLTTFQMSDFAPAFFQALGLPPFLINATPVGMSRNFNRDSDAYSVYGQLTWNMTERFRALFDLRYTNEQQDATGNSWPVVFPADTFSGVQRVARMPVAGHNREYLFFEKRTDDSLDPSVRLQFDLNDNMMVYGVWARGSKAGGMKANDNNLGDIMATHYNDPEYLQKYVGVSTLTDADLISGVKLKKGNTVFDFEDEEAESWEIGLKTSLLDGSATLNLALFTTEFKNLQTSNYDGARFIIGNAGQATVDGVEAEFNWQATSNLRIAASISYIDAKYDDFEGAECVRNPDNTPKNSDCVGTGTGARENQKGEKLERTPDLEYNLSAMWESDISDHIRLKLATSLYHSSSYFVQPNQLPYATQGAYEKWDARVALASTDERWEIAVNGRNLTDKMVINHGYNVVSYFTDLGIGRTVTIEGILRF